MVRNNVVVLQSNHVRNIPVLEPRKSKLNEMRTNFGN